MRKDREDVEQFVWKVLDREFEGRFARKPPRRLMFESENELVYFQNFNKPGDHLWYRVTDRPWSELRHSPKQAWLCFTNPPEGFAYLIPITDVEEQMKRAGWQRDYLEVNINPVISRWTELDWRIDRYLREPLQETVVRRIGTDKPA